MSLVNFFNSGSLSGSTTRSSTRCPSRHSPWCSSRHSSSSLRPSCTLVHLGNDRVAHTFQLFLLILIFILFCSLICIKPLNSIISFIFFCIIDHLLNIFFRKTTFVIRNCNFVLLSCRLVTSTNIENTICIHVKGDLNLWHSSWSWWDPSQVKLAQKMIVLGHGSLPFKDLDSNSWLVVTIGGEYLGLLGRNGCVSFDQ